LRGGKKLEMGREAGRIHFFLHITSFGYTSNFLPLLPSKHSEKKMRKKRRKKYEKENHRNFGLYAVDSYCGPRSHVIKKYFDKHKCSKLSTGKHGGKLD